MPKALPDQRAMGTGHEPVPEAGLVSDMPQNVPDDEIFMIKLQFVVVPAPLSVDQENPC